MNNVKKIYRVSKNGFPGVGPYRYIDYYLKDEVHSDYVTKLAKLTHGKERWANHKLKTVITDKLLANPSFRENGCMSSFSCHRPGIFDDPMLKYNLRKRGLNRLNMDARDAYSAFDSKEQMDAWFNDKEEKDELILHGFEVHEEKVPVDKIVYGLKQILVLK